MDIDRLTRGLSMYLDPEVCSAGQIWDARAGYHGKSHSGKECQVMAAALTTGPIP